MNLKMNEDKKVYIIEASSDEVPNPVSARFQWTNYNEVTLFGKNGIPVAPFRTSRRDGAIATGSRNGWLEESRTYSFE